MRRKFAGAGLSNTDWAAFEMVFKGNVDSILNDAKSRADSAIKMAVEGDPKSPDDPTKTPLENLPLNWLIRTRDEVKKEVGIDVQQQKKYDGLQRSAAQQQNRQR